MTCLDEIRTALRPPAGTSHLLKLSDVMDKLGLVRHECVVALDELIHSGEMRRTCDSSGEPYYWYIGVEGPASHC